MSDTDSMDERAEITPLLPNQKRRQPNPRFFLLTCLIILTLIEIGAFMGLVPQTRIYESIVCRKFYHDGRQQIPEQDCKIGPVQAEVATIRAVSGSLSSVPGILLSIPYGQLADNPKFGRKNTLLLSVIGIALAAFTDFVICWFSDILPLRLVWLASLWMIIGGGVGVMTAVLLTMVTDVVEPNQRATAFVFVSLSVQISQLVGPLLASQLVPENPWVAYSAGTVIVALCLPMFMVLPETIDLRAPKLSDAPEDHDDQSSQLNRCDHAESEPSSNLRFSFLRQYIFLKNPSLLLLLSSFYLSTIGRYQMELLVQYISARYGQPLASAGLVLSLNAIISLILLMGIIPVTSSYLQNTLQVSSSVKDLWLSQVSIIFLTIGCFVMGTSSILPTMLVGDVIYVLGTGFTILVRSLVTVYVDTLHTARVFAIVSVIQTLGLFTGGPLLALLFDWGFTMGKEWTGLPFVGSGVLHILICLVMWSIRLPAQTTPL